MTVKGICLPKFQIIKNIFEEYFHDKSETGANFSVVKNNKILVNIYGGFKNFNEPWDENTIVNTFSLSKGIYASCIAKLIESKKLDINKKVSFYWPEFKMNKETILVKDVLSHQSGLYRFKTKISNSDLLDFDKIINLLENQNPDHAPGEKTFYHAKTHGYLIENLIRKISSLDLKNFFYKNFSSPFKINFNFGFEEKDFKNVADLEESNLENNLKEDHDLNAFNNPQHDIKFYNSKDWRLAGVPSMGGHGSALAIAQIYSLLANDLKNNLKIIISKKEFEKILKPLEYRMDLSLNLPVKWTISGFILRGGWMFGKHQESFGHNGWGGSLGFADPVNGLGISYVTKKINSSMSADIRAVKLIKKVYDILDE